MGILIVSLSSAITVLRNELYWVWIILSSTVQKRWKPRQFSYLQRGQRDVQSSLA